MAINGRMERFPPVALTQNARQIKGERFRRKCGQRWRRKTKNPAETGQFVMLVSKMKRPRTRRGQSVWIEMRAPRVDHVHKVYGDDAEHIIRWLAHRVQRPHEKTNHALVLGGNQGIGKDLEVSPQQMLGRFNGFAKSVIAPVREARDLDDIDRLKFYDHMKVYTALHRRCCASMRSTFANTTCSIATGLPLGQLGQFAGRTPREGTDGAARSILALELDLERCRRRCLLEAVSPGTNRGALFSRRSL
jgi:hypothetical protein